MRLRRLSISFLPLGFLLLASIASTQTVVEPKLLPWSQQIAVREKWLIKRHAGILDLMRRHNVDMWLVVNEEFHNDPVTEFIAPPRPYAGNRDIFVFIDTGQKGLRKIAISGYSEESVARFFESPEDPKPADKVLPEIYRQYHPQHIALAMGGDRGITRGLTHATYEYLSTILGAEATLRFVPATGLLEEYLDTRIPEEMPVYTDMVRLTEILARRSLSNEVITPGTTTVGDVRRWLYDQLGARGLTTWFQPDLRVQRKGGKDQTSRGFLAVALENTVIERGDLVHLDFGFTYMGLNTDWQKMAYVLRDGEMDVPADLTEALHNTNALQDAVIRASRPGRTAIDVYNDVMAQMDQRGIHAQVYSHPLGNQGHGLGARIDFRAAQPGSPLSQKKLRLGSYLALELNTQTPAVSWNGQKVYAMQEDPVYLTGDGWKFFVPRQESFYIIH